MHDDYLYVCCHSSLLPDVFVEALAYFVGASTTGDVGVKHGSLFRHVISCI